MNSESLNSISDAVIEAAAESVLSARDMCGNEYLAAKEMLTENNVSPTDKAIFVVIERANALWNTAQRSNS